MSNTLTLTKAVDICCTAEMTTMAMKSLGSSTSGLSVNAVKHFSDKPNNGKPGQYKGPVAKPNPKPQSKNPATNAKCCQHCGKEPHDRKHCPAADLECRECIRCGHYAKMCWSKHVNKVDSEEFVFPSELTR